MATFLICVDCDEQYNGKSALNTHRQRCQVKKDREIREARADERLLIKCQDLTAQLAKANERAEIAEHRAGIAEQRACVAETQACAFESVIRQLELRLSEQRSPVVHNTYTNCTKTINQIISVGYDQYRLRFESHLQSLPRSFWGEGVDGVRLGLKQICAAASADPELAAVTRALKEPMAAPAESKPQLDALQVALLDAVKTQVPELAPELDVAARGRLSVFDV